MINSLSSYSNYNALQVQNIDKNQELNVKQINSTQNLVSDKSEAVSQVLGYGVDKEGFFTSDFNEKAGLAKDYKIYAKGAENFVNFQQSNDYFFSTHKKIDFAKTLANAYKVFSQLIPQTSNSSFSKEELENLPYAFSMDKDFNITKTYTYKEYMNDYMYVSGVHLTFNTIEDFGLGNGFRFVPIDENTIFNLDTQGTKISKMPYLNKDQSIDKAGVLMAFVNNTSIWGVWHSFLEGDTKLFGKLAGFDRNISDKELNAFQNFMNVNKTQSAFFDVSGENNEWNFIEERLSMQLHIKQSQATRDNALVKEAMDFAKEYEEMINLDLSLDEFKEKYLAFKQKHDDFVERLKLAYNQAQAKQENSQELETSLENKEKKPFTPIQAKSKNETYEGVDTNEFLKKLLEDSFDEKDFLKMLFEEKIEKKEIKNFDYLALMKNFTLTINNQGLDLKA